MQFDLDTATTRINSSRLMTQKELAEWKKSAGRVEDPASDSGSNFKQRSFFCKLWQEAVAAKK